MQKFEGKGKSERISVHLLLPAKHVFKCFWYESSVFLGSVGVSWGHLQEAKCMQTHDHPDSETAIQSTFNVLKREPLTISMYTYHRQFRCERFHSQTCAPKLIKFHKRSSENISFYLLHCSHRGRSKDPMHIIFLIVVLLYKDLVCGITHPNGMNERH